MSTTAAQDEFNDLVAKQAERLTVHPEDRNDPDIKPDGDLTEEDLFRNAQIDAAMRAPSNDHVVLKLPPASFDQGRTTGVKGVIADARSYETARRSRWRTKVQAARQSIFGPDIRKSDVVSTDSEEDRASNSDEDSFVSQWRESRRRELEQEISKEVRSRRTSPSMREFGRLEVAGDALGYLDAIEKVARDTTVVVFVYDNEVRPGPTLFHSLNGYGADPPTTSVRCLPRQRQPFSPW